MDVTTAYNVYSVIAKVYSLLCSEKEDSPLRGMAERQFDLALYELETFKLESNPRECLNRALTYLGSAYVNYRPTIKTWDFFDSNKVLWHKRSFANTICLYIAIIHYVLGNKAVGKKWLLDNLDDMGSIYFPKGIIETLSLPSEETFYKDLCQDDYGQLKAILNRSDSNFQDTFNSPSMEIIDPIYG